MYRASLTATISIALFLAGCSSADRLDRLEKEAQGLLQTAQVHEDRLTALEGEQKNHSERLETSANEIRALKHEVRGVSYTLVSVEPGSKEAVLFGNQSGHRAEVTVTNVTGGKTSVAAIQTRRIAKPSDNDGGPDGTVPSAPAPLPLDYEKTNWVDISSYGSRRQVVVPCGYEIAARSPGLKTRMSLLIKYSRQPCASP